MEITRFDELRCFLNHAFPNTKGIVTVPKQCVNLYKLLFLCIPATILHTVAKPVLSFLQCCSVSRRRYRKKLLATLPQILILWRTKLSKSGI